MVSFRVAVHTINRECPWIIKSDNTFLLLPVLEQLGVHSAASYRESARPCRAIDDLKMPSQADARTSLRQIFSGNFTGHRLKYSSHSISHSLLGKTNSYR